MNKLVKYTWNYLQICLCLLIPISVILFGPSVANMAFAIVAIIAIVGIGLNTMEMVGRRGTQLKE